MKHLLSGVAIISALALAAPASAQRSGPGPGAWTGTGPGVIPPGGPGPSSPLSNLPAGSPGLATPWWTAPWLAYYAPLRIMLRMLRLIIRHRLATTMGRRRVEASIWACWQQRRPVFSEILPRRISKTISMKISVVSLSTENELVAMSSLASSLRSTSWSARRSASG